VAVVEHWRCEDAANCGGGFNLVSSERDELNPDVDDIDELPSDPRPLSGSAGFMTRGGISSAYGAGGTVYKPSNSTSLENGETESTLPPPALWAMKYRRHAHLSFGRQEEDQIREQLGGGDESTFVIDDGAKRVMISRMVGVDTEGLHYVLVGCIKFDVYLDYRNGPAPLTDIFSTAKDLCLCSVFVATEAVSNIVPVETYRNINEVPEDYLPSHPLLEFTADDSE
jgi:hypothetical protein